MESFKSIFMAVDKALLQNPSNYLPFLISAQRARISKIVCIQSLSELLYFLHFEHTMFFWPLVHPLAIAYIRQVSLPII